MPKLIRGYEHKLDEPWEKVKVAPPGLVSDLAELEGKPLATVVSYEDGMERHAFFIFGDGSCLCLKGTILTGATAVQALPPLGLLVAGGLLTRLDAKKLAEEPLRKASEERRRQLQLMAEAHEREAARARQALTCEP